MKTKQDLVIEMKCLEFKPELIDFNRTATDNVWLQFGIDLQTYKGPPIKVDAHFMPEEEQQKLIDYMAKNYKKLKMYKRRKNMFLDRVRYEYLSYFPTSLEGDRDENKS